MTNYNSIIRVRDANSVAKALVKRFSEEMKCRTKILDSKGHEDSLCLEWSSFPDTESSCQMQRMYRERSFDSFCQTV